VRLILSGTIEKRIVFDRTGKECETFLFADGKSIVLTAFTDKNRHYTEKIIRGR
jgi:hypothetical protein